VTLQELDLLLAEYEGVLTRRCIQTQQTLDADFEIVSKPDAANAGGAYGHPLKPQFIGDPLSAVCGPLQAVVENLDFDLGRNAVGMWSPRAAAVLDQCGHGAGLEGAADLVEGVAVVAYSIAGTGHVAELLGELEQREFSSVPLSRGGRAVSSAVVFNP
jgi:hypothetical protein